MKVRGFFNTESKQTPHQVDLPPDLVYLNDAIALKKQKVSDNYSAFMTEILSDAQTAAAVLIVAKQAVFSLSIAPFAAGILPAVMLCAAVPAILSLASEIKKDNKDLEILNTIHRKYVETEDETILQSSKLFVKMHAPHHDVEEGQAPKRSNAPVVLKYHDMKPSIRALIEEGETMSSFGRKSLRDFMSRAALYSVPEKIGGTLKTIFNAFSLSIRACTVEAGKTLRTVGRGLKEIWLLGTRDRRDALSNMYTPTLYEAALALKAKGEGHMDKVDEVEVEAQIFNKDSIIHMRKLHTLQMDIRNNTSQRFVTAGGTMACLSFVSLALLQAGIKIASGQYVEAAGYIGLSAMLSVPSLRVLSERLRELAENDRDQDIRVATKLAKLGL